MRPHYFNQTEADKDDADLARAKTWKFVPPTCLLGGQVVMSIIRAGRQPCGTCNGPRGKCKGTPKRTEDEQIEEQMWKENKEEQARLYRLLTGNEQ